MHGSEVWSDSVLMTRIETYAIQVAEWKVMHNQGENADNINDRAYWFSRSELYREAAKTLKEEIADQLARRSLSVVIPF